MASENIKPENIALFDLDGTLSDYDTSLFKELEKLRSPGEKVYTPPFWGIIPEYIANRTNLIRSREEWWANLPKLQLGWDILDIAKSLEFKIMILTQGPRKNPVAWSGKKKWIDSNLGEETDITITRDKGLIYGKVLVDDFPEYIDRWLTWRKRGLVIMPANKDNTNYKHKQVIRYDGTNIKEVIEAMKAVKCRN